MTWHIKDHSYKIRHGESSSKNQKPSPEYVCFYSARARCQNPNDRGYPQYGGRGIQFRFDSYTDFLNHVGRKPSKEHSLDRINVNGHYEPGNVRWATRSQQQLNRTCTQYVTHDGKTLSTVEWSRGLGLSNNAVRVRLQNGWCESCAVSVTKQDAYRGCPHRENARVKPLITFQGKSQSIAAWGKELGFGRGVIGHRLRQGMSVEDALNRRLYAKR